MLFTTIYMFVCSGIGLLFGLILIFGKKPPLYFRLIVFALNCQFFSRVFYLISYLCYGGLPDTFNIGFIGTGTFMLSIFLSNFGQIDGIIDEGTKKFSWYRIVPLIIPAAEIACAVFAMTVKSAELPLRISYLIISVLAGLAGYFNLKHLIIPDVKNGVARSIRGFNAVCLITEAATLTEIGYSFLGNSGPIIILEVFLGILYMGMLPLLFKEVQKWKQ